MTETMQNVANITTMILAVLAVGTALVWAMGRLGRMLERPALWLGRYLFPDEEDTDGHG